MGNTARRTCRRQGVPEPEIIVMIRRRAGAQNGHAHARAQSALIDGIHQQFTTAMPDDPNGALCALRALPGRTGSLEAAFVERE